MKTYVRTSLTTVLMAALIVAAAGCQSDSRTVRIGYLPMVSSLTHFVALDQGFYAAAGISVDANPIKTSNLMAQDLIAGHIDVAIELSLVPLLKQLEASPRTAYIFSTSTITIDNGFDGIVTLASSPLTDLRMLSGRRVAVFPGTTARHTIADVFSTRFPGVPPPTFLELDPQLQIQALQNGEVEAVHTYEPTLTLGLVKDGLKKIAPSVYAMQFSPNPIGVAAVNAQWYNTRREQARALLNALDRAVLFIQNRPAEARKILAKANGLEARVAEAMNIMPLSTSSAIDRAQLNGYLGVLMRMGEITKRPSPNELCIEQR